jgi:alkylmercury lyase
MTVTSSDQLMQNLTALTAQNSVAAALVRITRPVIRLLAAGRPATIEEIARASGIPAGDVEGTLRAVPDVEWDEAGRGVALGLTSRPTDHVMEFDGRAMYAWCALESLIFAALRERPVVIRSRDHATGSRSTSRPAPRGRPPWNPPAR